tara:strand:+ start:2489 stop:2917 length:429 start_codon:yes stop_codon:yes gene_type:complete
MSKILLLRSIVIILVCFFIILISKNYSNHANLLPTFCATVIIIFSILDFVQNKKSFKFIKKNKINIKTLKPYLVILLSIVYVYLIVTLGFFVSTILYFIFTSIFLGVRNYKSIFITLIIIIPLMYGFFVIFLQTSLPKGFLI